MQKRKYLFPLSELRLAHGDAQPTSLCDGTVTATTEKAVGSRCGPAGGGGDTGCRRGLEDVSCELSIQT